MKMRVLLCAAALSYLSGIAFAQTKAGESADAQISFAGFQSLSAEVEPYRAQRLISHADFQAMAREPNTLVLDARSAEAYAQGHIDGAVNLPLPDFTAESLARAIPSPDTRILIYCNNNFENDVAPVVLKRIELALNIQTFINLYGYGYGYRDVYELGEVINFDDPATAWVRS